MMSEVIRDNGSSTFKKNFFYSLVVESCEEIFSLMLPMQMNPDTMNQRPLPFDIKAPGLSDDVVASIGVTGVYNGTISLFLPLDMALNMAGWLLEDTYTELNQEVYESVGEIINLIAGGLKNRLSTPEQEIFELSIPIVISGAGKHIFHGSDKEIIAIPIDTDKGLFLVSVVAVPV